MINSEDAGNKILRNFVPQNFNFSNTLHIPASQINQARKPTGLTFLMILFSRPNKIPILCLICGHYRICLVLLLSIIHYLNIILRYKYD